MFTRHLRAAVLAALFAVGILALPACNKKKSEVTDGGGPPAGYTGSKGGPPGGIGPQGGNTDPTLPAPPTGTPHYRSPDARSKLPTENNLKEIAIAFHNFHDAVGGLPLGIGAASGKVGLSWRVAILPYLGQENLYRQFKLNEPWDSAHNKALIRQMPKVFAPPGVDTNGYTYYRSFSGPNAVMVPPRPPIQPGQLLRGLGLGQVPDGTSNTLLVAEAAEPVIWTRPDDLPFEPGKPPKLGGSVFANGFFAARVDGSTVFVPNTVNPQTLSHLIQTDDGQVVDFP